VVLQSARPAAIVPAIIADAGEDAVTRFAEFFTANIRNPHTRRAYFRNAVTFLRWCESKGARELKAIKPVLVAAYIEQLQKTHSRPSVKQQLATIRMLFDWLVTGQVMAVNPAHAVRGPRHVVTQGKTPVLGAEETRALLDSIASERVAGITEDGKEIRQPELAAVTDPRGRQVIDRAALKSARRDWSP
jgi:site-specific recombinase XerD